MMVAIAFVFGAMVLNSELKRKEKTGLLFPKEETLIVGKPASFSDLLINFLAGFIFAYKIGGLFFDKPDGMNAQDYIFSKEGNFMIGILVGLAVAGWKWYEKNKQKLKNPEERMVRIWPHDRVGDIVIFALVFGILGAKLFDAFENWDDFIQHPIDRLISRSGLTFYGGLIVAAIAIIFYTRQKGIKLVHLLDAAAPALMIAYAIGRIGCQTAGDGDWGIFNSAYITNPQTHKVFLATPDEFKNQLAKYHTYFLDGVVTDSGAALPIVVTDRTSPSLDAVPHRYFKAPSFLPIWMVAYNYPQNVNKDGIIMPGISDDFNRVLPVPVFPTPFYETVVCSLLFLFLWSIRKKIQVPGVLFSVYLILNGIERFFVEKIRMNNTYHFLGMNPTQAEIISFFLVIFGVIFMGWFYYSRKKGSLIKL